MARRGGAGDERAVYRISAGTRVELSVAHITRDTVRHSVGGFRPPRRSGARDAACRAGYLAALSGVSTNSTSRRISFAGSWIGLVGAISQAWDSVS